MKHWVFWGFGVGRYLRSDFLHAWKAEGEEIGNRC